MKHVFLLCLFLAITAPAYALEAEEIVWGFDGKAVPGRFNVLSVLLSNQTDFPYKGNLAFYKIDGLGRRQGAQLVKPCFISPYTSRWVQFYPYVNNEIETWVISPGGIIGKTIEIPSPRLGAPASVILADPDNPFEKTTVIKSFREDLFPSTVTATDGLYAVIMDHVPRWQAPTRLAFLDWVRRGGVVHILHDGLGQYPVFTSELSLLNTPVENFRIGAGRIIRHAFTRHEISGSPFADQERSAPALKVSASYDKIEKLEDDFFAMLGKMTKPAHNWTLIYLIAVVYLIILGPVNWLFGRKRRNYWLTIIFFLAAVLIFGYILNMIGHRGFGESDLVHTISYARQVGNDTYDVTQWTSVFVTSGDYYDVSHPSSHNLYSTCQDYESVNGVIMNGKNGRFMIDIPLYSSRAFHHRSMIKGPTINLNVLAWEGENTLEKLVIEAGPGFPEDTMEIYALYRNLVYPVIINKGKLSAGNDRVTPFSEFFPAEMYSFWGRDPYEDWFGYDSGTALDEKREFAKKMRKFHAMKKALMARGIGGTEVFQNRIEFPRSGDPPVQLFIYARSPESFGLKERGFGKEISYVLYHVDVFRPEGKEDNNDRDD